MSRTIWPSGRPTAASDSVEVTWKKMLAAGVVLGWGSGSAPPPGRVYNKECNCSHGVQGEMFPVLVSWGASPVYTLRMATTVNAEIIHMSDKLGTIEKGKFADIIAVSRRSPCRTFPKCST